MQLKTALPRIRVHRGLIKSAEIHNFRKPKSRRAEIAEQETVIVDATNGENWTAADALAGFWGDDATKSQRMLIVQSVANHKNIQLV